MNERMGNILKLAVAIILTRSENLKRLKRRTPI